LGTGRFKGEERPRNIPHQPQTSQLSRLQSAGRSCILVLYYRLLLTIGECLYATSFLASSSRGPLLDNCASFTEFPLSGNLTYRDAKMDDKKNEDYNIEMPDYKGRSSPSQRDPFLAKSPSRHSSNGPPAMSNITNSPMLSILAYCLGSISMTVTNKYCVSGANWNLNFFYLGIQVGPPQLPKNSRLKLGTNSACSLLFVS
jgi:hypothetical protein